MWLYQARLPDFPASGGSGVANETGRVGNGTLAHGNVEKGEIMNTCKSPRTQTLGPFVAGAKARAADGAGKQEGPHPAARTLSTHELLDAGKSPEISRPEVPRPLMTSRVPPEKRCICADASLKQGSVVPRTRF